MKKLSLLFILTAAICRLSMAQTLMVSGTVKNGQGNPVHYAFVTDEQLQNATYTDSAGAFKIMAAPAAKLNISCKGYNDTLVNVTDNTHLQVILKMSIPGTNADTEKTAEVKSLESAFGREHSILSNPEIGFGGNVVYNNQKETKGSRFLFDQWVHGYMVKANGEIVQNSALLFNYDKMKGDLYLVRNFNSIMLADKNVIKSFALFGPHDEVFTFERMMGIDTGLYSQVISSGKNYKIYKLITTKFIPSNYTSNGITSTGNLYNEFADIYAYYVLNLKTNSFQQINLRKKAIKTVFADEGDKLNNFMASHSHDTIDESYLINLCGALNE